MVHALCYGNDTLHARQTRLSIGAQKSSIGNFTYYVSRNKTELTKYIICDEQPFTYGE